MARTDRCQIGQLSSFSTSYTEDGSNLTIAASTMMACEEPVMAQANTFMTALTSATTFSVADGEPDLGDGSQTLATFSAGLSDLADTAWDVVNYNNGREAVVTLLLDTEITAYFGADSMVTGNAGCNQYFAEYSTDGDTISIGMAGSSMRFCPEPEGVMEQESEYLAALQSAATYSISGDMLQMRTDRRPTGRCDDPPRHHRPAGASGGTRHSYRNRDGDTGTRCPTGPGTNFR